VVGVDGAQVYRKKGVWNFTTLEYDLEECGGGSEGFDLEPEELWSELIRLNSMLEAKGIKAFGDIEESMYKKKDGEWTVEALEEDVKVCLEELALQGIDEAVAGVSNKNKNKSKQPDQDRVQKLADLFGTKGSFVIEDDDTEAVRCLHVCCYRRRVLHARVDECCM
jgi:hypothetical protein